MKGLAYTFFGLAIIVMCLGGYKLYVYENNSDYSDENYQLYSDDNKNAYVGADAYNYIINAGQSTAYFVLTGVFAMCGFASVFLARRSQETDDLRLEIIKFRQSVNEMISQNQSV